MAPGAPLGARTPLRAAAAVLHCLVALAALQQCLAFSKDPYKVLGLSKGASDAEMKSAYKKLALKYHPDKARWAPEGTRLGARSGKRAAVVILCQQCALQPLSLSSRCSRAGGACTHVVPRMHYVQACGACMHA